MSLFSFIYSQLFVTLPVPTHDFTDQFIVVTGANSGLGLEAARYFLKLNAARVILAVRSMDKGEAARNNLETSSTREPGVLEVYHLDMESAASVKAFVTKIARLPRVDVLLLNAGKVTQEFYLVEGDESTIAVNVVNTFLLILLMLPKLRQNALALLAVPRIVVVASDRHVMTNLPEWKTENTFATLNDPSTAKMHERYYVSKLLEILLMRALGNELAAQQPQVSISALTPGYCRSQLTRSIHGLWAAQLALMTWTLSRSAEEGARTLVHAASLGWESNGKYLNDCRIDENALSSFVRSEEGSEAQRKVWEELLEKLEKTCPGVTQIVSGY
ncbi:Short chain dehydrogenase yanD [Penicillium rolfsii]|nr:Short chain dehydrogenase yanD [Penicillium rolfsii]